MWWLLETMATICGAVVFFGYTLSIFVDPECHRFFKQPIVKDSLLLLLLPFTLPLYGLEVVGHAR